MTSDAPDISDASGAWATMAPLGTPRTFLGLGAVTTSMAPPTLHAIGGREPGNSGAVLTTHEVYDPSKDLWTKAPPMQTARSGLAVAVFRDEIYAIGGFATAGQKALNTIEVFANGAWTALPPMPTPRAYAAVGVVGYDIFVIGGRVDPFGNCTAVNESFNVQTNKWTTGHRPLGSPRAGMASAVIFQVIYLFGGAPKDEVVQSTAEAYNAYGDDYASLAAMPTARIYAGAATAVTGAPTSPVGLYVIGGSAFATEEFLPANELFDPYQRQWVLQTPVPVDAPMVSAAATIPDPSAKADAVYVTNYSASAAQTQTLRYLIPWPGGSAPEVATAPDL